MERLSVLKILCSSELCGNFSLIISENLYLSFEGLWIFLEIGVVGFPFMTETVVILKILQDSISFSNLTLLIISCYMFPWCTLDHDFDNFLK